jgi:hypothetical protein
MSRTHFGQTRYEVLAVDGSCFFGHFFLRVVVDFVYSIFFLEGESLPPLSKYGTKGWPNGAETLENEVR